jgi:hypothetical protein
MLGKMPVDFWKKINKVFEPCCGKGNFVMKIFEMFFNGLAELYPDVKKRCAVIITECLYFSDITPMNVFITCEILKCEIQLRTGIKEIKYKFNSNVGNTLELDINKKWGLDKFDAVIGNPPYNSSQNNKGKKGGGDLLWNKFVVNSINVLKENGYLIFVHPPGWRKPESEKSKFKNLFELMVKDNQMIYLEIHDTKDGKSVFNAGTRYDWYHIQKIKQYKKTIIKGEDNKIYNVDLNNWNFLPNSNFDIIEKMLLKDNDKKCKIMYSRSSYGSDRNWVSNKKTNEYKYELIHSTPQNGIRYMYSSKNDKGHFGIKKVIFGDSGIYNSIIDMEGKYGMTQHSMAIQIKNKNEGNEIKKVLDSEEFKKILKSCSWSNFQIDWRLFTYFKKIFYKEIKI